jgi:hypothetical protein
MKKLWILTLSIILAFQSMAEATSTVDVLIQKLTEKGILTQQEADQIKGQIAYEEKQAAEEGYKKQAPEWVQNFKLSGDFRGRLQTERRKQATSATQDSQERIRGRIRARLNMETKVNDKAKVIVGIATDGGTSSSPNNPRSTNMTLSGNNSGTPFSKANVVLNKAYGQYMFNDKWTISAGKMDNPIWEPMEFLWDSDITPEGVSLQYNRKVNSAVNFFSTGSFFMLNEFPGSSADPFMFVGQTGLMIKPNPKFDTKAAFTYTGYGNIKNGFTGGTGTGDTLNTRNAALGTTGLKYDYRAPMVSIDVGINDPFGETLPLYIPRVGAFGEYTNNPAVKKGSVAWMTGIYLGNSKVNGFGTWKLIGAYKVIQRDAVLDIFPDSDFYGGATGVKGMENVLEIGLAKNLSFTVDYYRTIPIHRTAATGKAPEHVVQYDINWKF